MLLSVVAMRVRGVVLLGAGLVALGSTTGANALIRSSSGAKRLAAATTSIFCSRALAYENSAAAKDPVASTPATLKADYAKFKIEEPSVLAVTPSSIRSDVAQLFAFDTKLFSDLAAAGWNVLKLTAADQAYLKTESGKIGPASEKLISYLNTTCGAHLPVP